MGKRTMIPTSLTTNEQRSRCLGLKHRRACLTIKEVIVILKDFAEYGCGKTSKKYWQRRKTKRVANGRCFVCGGDADYYHHIFSLQFNGRDKSWNRIQICHNCHCEIHEWMIPEEPDFILEMDREFKNILDTPIDKD